MIRTATIEDAPILCHLCQTALGHTASVEQITDKIAKLTKDPACYLIVLENEITHTVDGFLQAEEYRLLYGEDGWNVIALAVESQSRRQGIGRQLLSALERYAAARQAGFIRLNCREERKDVHTFYESNHYSCDKTQKRFIKYL